MKQFLKERMDRGKKKGTVLLTVVGVMMVLVVFLISTLILTAASNRRSYYTYYETQAQYAAQAALDAITNSAYSNSAFYTWVSENVKQGEAPKPITVDFDDNSKIQFSNSDKVVECYIERVDDDYVWDDTTSAIHAQRAWKITATASVGKGRNQADCTVCNYIYENYRPKVDELENLVANASEGNTYSYKYNPPTDQNNNNPLIGAMTRVGGSNTNSNVIVLGPNAANIGNLPLGRGNYDSAPKSYRMDTAKNPFQFVGENLFVNNFTAMTYFDVQFQKRGEGFVVYGNLELNSSASYIYSNLQNDHKPTTYNDLNYIYVDGKLKAFKTFIGLAPSKENNYAYSEYQVNVYAGALEADDVNGLAVYGDVYLYDPNEDSKWGYNTDAGKTILVNFIDNQVNGTNGYRYSKTSGSLFCNNKSLKIANDCKIMGDIRFTNPAGTLTFGNNVQVYGNIYVACPSTSVTGAANVSFPKGGKFIYENVNDTYNVGTGKYYSVKPPSGTVTETKEIPGAESYSYTFVADPNVLGWNEAQAYLKQPGNVWANYDGDLKDPSQYVGQGAYHEEVIYGPSTTQTITSTINYNFSLFPFERRLDEIFDTYYRWDLKATTLQAAKDAMDADKLVEESIACGHKWKVDEEGSKFKDANGNVYYVPYTTPTNSNNKFIPANTKMKASNTDVYTSMKIATNLQIDSLTEFLGAGKTQAEVCPDYVDNIQNVTMIYHDADGTEKNDKVINNAYVINSSCTINCNSLSGKTLFIDPSYNNYSDSNPLKIIFEGKFENNSTTIIMNNTATYNKVNANAYGTPVSYASQCKEINGEWQSKFAGRTEIQFYWKTGFGQTAQPMVMYPTGACEQFENKELFVVSNPIYPKTSTSLDNITAKYKYSYELTPNNVVFADENAVISFPNAQLLYGAFIMPTATVESPNSHNVDATKFKVTYREEYDCGDALSTGDKNTGYVRTGVGCVGSMFANIDSGPNNMLVVYIGDGNRMSTPGYEESSTGQNSTSNYLGNTYKDWFSNNYQGAN